MIHRRPVPRTGARRDNASTGEGEWEHHMTPRARGLIEDLYAQDFEMFGYARLPMPCDA